MKTENTENKKTEKIGKTKPIHVILALILLLIYCFIGATIFFFVEQRTYFESLYWVIITLTTVGYGDIYPRMIAGKLLFIFYVPIGFIFMGYVLTNFTKFLYEKQSKLIQKCSNITHNLFLKILILFLFFLILLTIGTLSYCLLENWSIIDSLYFSMVTSTTVGYGDEIPSNPWTKVFSIFYVLSSTVLCTFSLGTIADEIINQFRTMKEEELLNRELSVFSIQEMDQNQDGKVSQQEFVEFMLLKIGRVSKSDLQRIKDKFNALDKDNSGELDHDDINKRID